MALTLSGTNGVVGAGFSITPGGAVAGIVTVGAAVTISESGIEASGIGITCASINGGQIGTKNKFINGDMRISQKATSSTSITSSANICQTLDRWTSYVNDSGTYTNTQATVTDLPGFDRSNKWEVTSADASVAANSYLIVGQTIERNNLADLKKGTSSAKSTTVSFYVKCSITGTFLVELSDVPNTRGISTLYTINSANTWERKVITFPGDTSGTMTAGISGGISVFWWLQSGSTHNSGTLQSSWQTRVNANRAVGITNLGSTNGATWEITGVQFETGDQATDFEPLDYDSQLSLCHRYYQKITGGGNCQGIVGSGGEAARMGFPLLKPMRAAPSVVVTGDLKCYDGTTTRTYNGVSGVYVVSAFAFDFDTGSGQATAGSAMAAGRGCVLYSNASTGGFECTSEI